MKTDYKPIKRRRFFYNGDINIKHGGYFYCIDTLKWDYVDAVRVTPCSDAGGPDNMFWVERLMIHIQRDEARLRSILETSGYEGEEITDALLVEAHIADGSHVEVDTSECIRIGPRDPLFNGREEFAATHNLRGNTSLRRYARSLCST